MKRIIHPVAGALAVLTIATFWTSTALAELVGSKALIVAVKSALPWGFLVLIPALAATGGSGIALAKGVRTGRIGTKLRRMPFIAANGLLVLVPAALVLASKAKAGEFDTTFYVVQAIELIAGPVNLVLLGLSMRDGLQMTGRLQRAGQATFDIPLIGKETVADGTMAFRFRKPAGFDVLAGQSAVFTLMDSSEHNCLGSSRTFTIASAPHEPDLLIATRMGDSEFKRGLKTLPQNGLVRVSGIGGKMILHTDPARPAVFLTGGIGITPFLAMARHAAHARLPHRITLFYANRQPQDAAFLAELQDMDKAIPTFHLVAAMTDETRSSSSHPGEVGPIDEAMLRRHVSDLLAPIYYLAGPAAMVAAMQTLLLGLGVAKPDIRFEEFLGY